MRLAFGKQAKESGSGLGGSNQVRLNRARLVNGKVWVIRVRNPDYQGALQTKLYLIHCYCK